MIWRSLPVAWLLLAGQQYEAVAQPTWPASTDELEDLMFLNSGYRARSFPAAVTPCSTGVAPGRIAAAEWIRTAFHDMATGSVFSKEGGLDGSIAFETRGGDNIGPAFLTTLTTYAPFFSSRLSLSDIIAAGVYTATRSCGGPIVPVRGGRVDATTGGGSGVPLPQNSIGTFENQFLRIGYSRSEMIAFTACGHSLGGVHSDNFNDIVPPGTAPNGFAAFDTSQAVFDNKVVTEFLDKSTKNPLVTSNTKKNSDLAVFTAETNNATMNSLTNAATFANTCKAMFQKMIEVVPEGVVLTDVVAPYEVKPYALQLSLLDGGSSIGFTGDIRVRTTQRSVAQVRLVYKDRTGAAVATPITTTSKGNAQGFDDTFAFFGFDTKLPADKSISSFNVVVTLSGGATQTFDNNGNGFKVDDNVIYQAPQSCLDGSGKLTVVAAVRNGATPNLNVIVKNPSPSPVVIPSLSTATAAMTSQSTSGSYQLYSGSYTFSGSQAQSAVFGVSAGSSTDDYKSPSGLPTACSPTGSSTPSSTPSATPSSSAFTFQGCYTDKGAPRALSATFSIDDTITVEKCADFCKNHQLFGLEYGKECYCGNALDASSTIASLSDCNMPCAGNAQQTCGAGNRMSTYKNTKFTAPVNPDVAGYKHLGCYSEATAGRALSDTLTTSDTMTVQACSTFCNGATYFGVEYGKECYCGSKLQAGSTLQPASDCSMLCAGNSATYCGAGNRLNVYEKGAASSSSTTPVVIPSTSLSTSTISSSTSTPASSTSTSTTATPTGPSLTGYQYQGCIVDSVQARIINAKTTQSDTNTYTSCASFCTGYSYFGVEYGRECFCGDSVPSTLTKASDLECSMSCSGKATSKCGDADRITLFKSTTVSTGPSNPVIQGYTYAGCRTDSVGARVLQGSFLFDEKMTIEKCGDHCKGTRYFGTQYGGECYCGSAFSNPSVAALEKECSFLCEGNRQQFCGAGDRLSLWEKV